MNPTRRTVAGVIFNSEKEILLCERGPSKKYAPGAWHMPGGGIDEGESPEDALRRELMEELDLQLGDTILDTGVRYTYGNPGQTDDHVLFYTAYAVNTPRLANHENSAFVFVNEDQFPKYLRIARRIDEVEAILTFNHEAAAAARKLLG